MHRDVLTKVCVTRHTDFLVTASADGHLKFWKKLRGSIQFVKHFKAHLGPIVDLQSSHDGARVCTLSSDKTLKIYEVGRWMEWVDGWVGHTTLPNQPLR